NKPSCNSRANGSIERQLSKLNASADRQRIQGRYAEAEALFQRALALATESFGPKHLAVASVLNNLAVVYKYSGRFDEAERLYWRALPIIEKAGGPEHPDVASVYHNLAGLEHAREEYARGEPFA